MQLLFVVAISIAINAAAESLQCLNESPRSNNDTSVASNPLVTIQNGTVIGTTSGAVDTFLGIPYAQPPVGRLRLKPPQPINSTYGILNVTSLPIACPQLSNPPFNESALPADLAAVIGAFLPSGEPQGEDCLTLSIYRPSHADACSRLPVVLWIYGGGFEVGSTQLYNATSLITKSVQLGQPIVFVSMNYRLGGFGFLAGKELQNDASTNLGLRDQRLAMEWVHENIEKFGGDPLKVTIMGESAGSVSALDHLVINKGNNFYRDEPLFRAGIMDSGSILTTESAGSSEAQAIYDQVVAAANCSEHLDTLGCLREISYSQFRAAVDTFPNFFSYKGLDLAYLPRFDPNDDGFFSTSPEFSIQCGTIQSYFNRDIIDYLATILSGAKRQVLVDLATEYYPDDPSAGSPFRTGPANEIYPQYKHLSAIFGDLFFQWPHRLFLSTAVAEQVPSWSYLSSYLYGTPVLGTFHNTDILGLFGEGGGLISGEVIDSIQKYYISFINHLHPNAFMEAASTETDPLVQSISPAALRHQSPQVVISGDYSNGTSSPNWLRYWPRYDISTKLLLKLGNDSNRITTDDYRERAFNFYAEHQENFRL